jgi:alkylhydroperoxidase family enzyme
MSDTELRKAARELLEAHDKWFAEGAYDRPAPAIEDLRAALAAAEKGPTDD